MNDGMSKIDFFLLLGILLSRSLILPELAFQSARAQTDGTPEVSPALAVAGDMAQIPEEQTQGNFNASSPEKGPDYLLIAVIALAVSGFTLVLLGSTLKRTGR